jgi:non-ribosomal peptide synthetase component F
MFINMLAMRIKLRAGETFRELLAEVKQTALEAFANQDYQFEALVKQLNLSREPGRNPMFDVEFTFQNFPLNALEIPGLTLKPYRDWHASTRFDLSIQAAEEKGCLTVVLSYATQLFKPSTIQDIKTNLLESLEQVTANPMIKLEDIKYSFQLAAAPVNPQTQQIQFDF